MKDIEIEIQVQVENVEPLRTFLEESAQATGTKRQIDRYFVPAHRDFLAADPIAEWLRLRDQDGTHSITYKYWHIDSTHHRNYADEFETGIDNIGAMEKMLAALDFKPIVTVDKTRHTWHYQNYEIAIDAVKDLGDFVEIEYKGSEEITAETAITEMIDFLKTRQVGRIRRNTSGYPGLLLFPEQATYIEY